MRIKLEFKLCEEAFPIDYRPVVLSFFKSCLSKYENGKYLENYYEAGKAKDFSFALEMPNSKFLKDKINVTDKKIFMIISTHELKTGILLFNSILLQKNRAYPLENDNDMILKNVVLMREKDIVSEKIEVFFKAPLCVRSHIKETNKDMYYSSEREGFKEQLNKIIEAQVEIAELPKSILEGFNITPLKCRKTVVKHHGQFIEATLGNFMLEGNITLLDYLYKSGIGSRKSAGFGLIEIVGG